MELRAAFNRAREGDDNAHEEMQQFARDGSKEAEAVLMTEIKRIQANSPATTFSQALTAASGLYPNLHRAYLNCNGVKPF